MTAKEQKEVNDRKLKKLDSYENRVKALKAKMERLYATDKNSDKNFNQILAKISVMREKLLDYEKYDPVYAKKIKESLFYGVCDAVEEVGDISFVDGFFPTVDMLKNHQVKNNLHKYLHLVIFYSMDPFGRFDEEVKDSEEYRETVRYCRQLVSEAELKEG